MFDLQVKVEVKVEKNTHGDIVNWERHCVVCCDCNLLSFSQVIKLNPLVGFLVS